MSFVSYAQNFEDVLLNRVFAGQDIGFYVDVGAYHPVDGSITKAFYDRGWSGINAEPGSVFAELAAARPRDVNLQMAVMDHAGEIAYLEDETDRGTSHVVPDGNASGVTRMVPCDTLEAIVRTHARGRPVDFLKVDAEGAEAAIVRSTDWRRLRPRVLLFEATLLWSTTLANQDWEPVLLGQGYVRAYFDGINCFYLPEEEAPVLLRHFQVPVNVLDHAVRYDPAVAEVAEERNRLRTETATLGHDLETLRAALHDTQQEIARLSEEQDLLEKTLDAEQKMSVGLAEERDAVRAALAVEQTKLARTGAELEVVRSDLDSERKSAAQLAAQRDALSLETKQLAETVRELEARLPSPSPQLSSVTSPPSARRRLSRRAALVAYRLVRPVVRPAAWRLRTFILGGIVQHFDERARTLSGQIADHQDERTHTFSQQFTDLRDVTLTATRDGAATATAKIAEHSATAFAEVGKLAAESREHNAASLAEMHRLAEEMERVLLTLALEPSCAGFTAKQRCSVRSSDGDWEPHIRNYLRAVVQPDWTCFDIGANLGAHTLSLAKLAWHGQVVAFEPDPTNHALLARNASALTGPKAHIETVRLALWDSRATLLVGGADELAGCGFVVEDAADADKTERRLRAVVDTAAIGQTELHTRTVVPAMPLDEWADAHPVPRLDLIKLDVEGAQVRVIRGADALLRRHRPVLLVEYNPACAEAYFGQSADALFRELVARFAAINALEPDGTLTPIADWAALQARLARGKGWEDLVCVP